MLHIACHGGNANKTAVRAYRARTSGAPATPSAAEGAWQQDCQALLVGMQMGQPRWRQPRCPSAGECIRTLGNIQKMDM